MGLFAAHRATALSKQRALNINSIVAKRLMSARLFALGGTTFPCRILFGDVDQISDRYIGKVGKNWRLGGNKIIGGTFSNLDSKDFALIRSIESNDAGNTITILFLSKTHQRSTHADVVRLVEPVLNRSMAVFLEGSAGFPELASLFPVEKTKSNSSTKVDIPKVNSNGFPVMPKDELLEPRKLTTEERLNSPHILEQMLKVSSDLSASEQLSFFETIKELAFQLRTALLATNRIIKIEKNHKQTWDSVNGKNIGFVDGGLANLSMLGSAPVAARVGGYIVRPGDFSKNRERFIVLKKLVNELYSSQDKGVYDNSFPDVSALRDAARISIEAAGAVNLLIEEPDIHCLLLHGALVNPVSKYTDTMRDEKPIYKFPNFSESALEEIFSKGQPLPTGRNANFIPVYLG
ncbi:MAG TPA: hypothetical protein VHS53_19005, partial [Mucilaginibacter sp.]|nr:hypothetical protein [Mucilaginibacter sp.]